MGGKAWVGSKGCVVPYAWCSAGQRQSSAMPGESLCVTVVPFGCAGLTSRGRQVGVCAGSLVLAHGGFADAQELTGACGHLQQLVG